MKLKYLALIGFSALAGASFSASAIPIDGEVTFGMSVNSLDAKGGTQVSLASANYIDVKDDTAVVTNVSGILAIPLNDLFETVTYNDFYVDGSDLPLEPLWEKDGLSFSLTSIQLDPNPTNFLIGQGIMSLAGYDNTLYNWSFSADSSGGTFRAASSSNTPVPEPGTLALLGLGLAGLGAARRRQKT